MRCTQYEALRPHVFQNDSLLLRRQFGKRVVKSRLLHTRDQYLTEHAVVEWIARGKRHGRCGD